MSTTDIALIIAGCSLIVGAIPLGFRLRKNRRVREQVWDEIIGHDSAPGVEHKLSLVQRITLESDKTTQRFRYVGRRLKRLEQKTDTTLDIAKETMEAVTNGNGNGSPCTPPSGTQKPGP